MPLPHYIAVHCIPNGDIGLTRKCHLEWIFN